MSDKACYAKFRRPPTIPARRAVPKLTPCAVMPQLACLRCDTMDHITVEPCSMRSMVQANRYAWIGMQGARLCRVHARSQQPQHRRLPRYDQSGGEWLAGYQRHVQESAANPSTVSHTFTTVRASLFTSSLPLSTLLQQTSRSSDHCSQT